MNHRGGSVRVTKSNVWITLAPYFFPLYTFVVAAVWLIMNWLWPPIQPYAPIFVFWIGLTWSFHLTFTVRYLRYNQPDIREHGRLFSYTLIYVLNLLTVGPLWWQSALGPIAKLWRMWGTMVFWPPPLIHVLRMGAHPMADAILRSEQ